MQNAVIGKQIKFGTYIISILIGIGVGKTLEAVHDTFKHLRGWLFGVIISSDIGWGAVGTAGESGSQSEEHERFERLHGKQIDGTLGRHKVEFI
jgi:hypothetical protein